VQEKATRGALKAAVERAISKKTIVILDSLNNIKVWYHLGHAAATATAVDPLLARVQHQRTATEACLLACTADSKQAKAAARDPHHCINTRRGCLVTMPRTAHLLELIPQQGLLDAAAGVT
jgi:hypothetical protein